MSAAKDISIELLSSGHVNSFVLFFELQHTISDTDLMNFRDLLVDVEDSNRTSNETAMYESATKFAQYFQKLNMMELALEYFQNALTAAKKMTKEYHYEIDGTCNLALAIRKDGRLQEALEDFQKARELAKLQEDVPRVQNCSIYLLETFICIAEAFESEDSYENSIPIYQKCLELLKETDPNLELKEATNIIFRLGKCYKKIGKIDESVKNLEQFLSNQRALRSTENEGVAQLLLASCYECSNKQTLAISYLEFFIAQAQNDPLQRQEESRACKQLAILFSKMEKYELAASYFDRHFQLTKNSKQTLNRRPSSEMISQPNQIKKKEDEAYIHESLEYKLSKVQSGIAEAKLKMGFFFETVADPAGVSTLIKWKAKRDFGDYIPPSRRVNLHEQKI